MLKTARKKLSNAPPELNSQRWRKNRREASREKGAGRWRGGGGGGGGVGGMGEGEGRGGEGVGVQIREVHFVRRVSLIQ